MKVLKALAEWMRVKGRSAEYLSFAVRRASGLLLAAYLVVHMVDISTLLLGEEAYNALLEVFHGPLGLAFDATLIALLSLHGALGLYSMIVEAGLALRWRRALLALAWAGALAVTAAAVWVMLSVW